MSTSDDDPYVRDLLALLEARVRDGGAAYRICAVLETKLVRILREHSNLTRLQAESDIQKFLAAMQDKAKSAS